jgi:hypothetical protein
VFLNRFAIWCLDCESSESKSHRRRTLVPG